MPRVAEGWTLREDPRTGIFLVRFRVAGQRLQRSTGESLRARATVVAARIYSEAVVDSTRTSDHDEAPLRVATPAAVEARVAPPSPARAGLVTLESAFARWVKSLDGELDESTVDTYELYARKHWAPHFRTLEAIDDNSCAELVRARLAKVRRRTVLKEISALRGFLAWAVGAHLIDRAPTIESPGRRVVGTEHDGGKRRRVLVELEPLEVEAILTALPERTAHGHPARSFFTVLYETSLRYSTVTALRAPEDYARGRSDLVIRNEADKARFGRILPLSRRAAAALDMVCPQEGLIFGRISLRGVLKAAGIAAGLEPFRAHHLGYHTFRHARLTHLGERTTNLAGLAYLAGHKHVTTTALYVHAGRRAASALLADVEGDEGDE
jgi:integrase